MITENREKINKKEEESTKEQLRIFTSHKQKAENLQNLLASLYKTEGSSRGQAVRRCGTELWFRRYNIQDKSKLESANFCKHKLCPFCAWRWHLKYSKILAKTFEELGKGEYYHLVLTIPNIKHISKEFILALREKSTHFLKNYLKIFDYFLSFEITIDERGFYHPHYHIVFKHNKKLPTKKEMQTKWAQISCCGNKYAIIHIDKCTENTKGISQELTKYILKFDDKALTRENLLDIYKSTKGIRKFSTSGVIKQAEQKAKNKIDAEDFHALQELGDDYDLDFYKWIGGKYQIQESISAEEREWNE